MTARLLTIVGLVDDGHDVPEAARRIAATDKSTSASVVVALDTEMRMSRRPCHVVPPTQQVPSRCDGGDHPVGALVVPEPGERLVESGLARHLDPGRGQGLGEPPGEIAQPDDEVGDAVPAEFAQRRPHRETACPPGGLQDVASPAGRRVAGSTR